MPSYRCPVCHDVFMSSASLFNHHKKKHDAELAGNVERYIVQATTATGGSTARVPVAKMVVVQRTAIKSFGCDDSESDSDSSEEERETVVKKVEVKSVAKPKQVSKNESSDASDSDNNESVNVPAKTVLVQEASGLIKCSEPGCTVVFESQKAARQHMSMKHGKKRIQVEAHRQTQIQAAAVPTFSPPAETTLNKRKMITADENESIQTKFYKERQAAKKAKAEASGASEKPKSVTPAPVVKRTVVTSGSKSKTEEKPSKVPKKLQSDDESDNKIKSTNSKPIPVKTAVVPEVKTGYVPSSMFLKTVPSVAVPTASSWAQPSVTSAYISPKLNSMNLIPASLNKTSFSPSLTSVVIPNVVPASFSIPTNITAVSSLSNNSSSTLVIGSPHLQAVPITVPLVQSAASVVPTQTAFKVSEDADPEQQIREFQLFQQKQILEFQQMLQERAKQKEAEKLRQEQEIAKQQEAERIRQEQELLKQREAERVRIEQENALSFSRIQESILQKQRELEDQLKQLAQLQSAQAFSNVTAVPLVRPIAPLPTQSTYLPQAMPTFPTPTSATFPSYLSQSLATVPAATQNVMPFASLIPVSNVSNVSNSFLPNNSPSAHLNLDPAQQAALDAFLASHGMNKMPELKLDLESAKHMLNDLLNSQIVLVDSRETLSSALIQLSRFDVLAVDCEGVDMDRTGKLCVLSIAAENMRFVFDVVALGNLMFESGLKSLLESQTVVKLFFDCRRDSDALFHQYQIRLRNVLDCQMLELAFRKQYGQNTSHLCGLAKALEMYLPELAALHSFRDLKTRTVKRFHEDTSLWNKRPLDMDLIKYAAFDVSFLRILAAKLQENMIMPLNTRAWLFSARNVAIVRDHPQMDYSDPSYKSSVTLSPADF